jgi:uncharacterized protein (DUF58 family)
VSGLLPPRLLSRLEALQLGTRRRLAGQLAGEHRSSRHGTSLDFADYRAYHPGDDFRRIDYHLYARLDVLLLKLFEAEDEIHVRLLVDTSASMGEGGKLTQAARVAAALGFVALVRRDPVTLHTFPFEGAAPRFVGRAAAPRLFRHLEALEPSGTTPLVSAATHLLARPGRPGLTVVCSDLLTPEWEAGLARLPARGGDVVVVHVLAPGDLRPDLVGDLELVDAEGAGRVPVSCSPETLAAYQKAAEAWADDVAGRCRAAGAAYVRVGSGDDIEPLLVGGWRQAGVLR